MIFIRVAPFLRFVHGWMAVLVTLAICDGHKTWGQDTLPGTQRLDWEGDIASMMVEEIDQFLLRQLDLAGERRKSRWDEAEKSTENQGEFIEARRLEFKALLGMSDERTRPSSFEFLFSDTQALPLARCKDVSLYAVRWEVFAGVHGVGYFLRPSDAVEGVSMILVPDADQSLEQAVGLESSSEVRDSVALSMANQGYQVLVPLLISREVRERKPPERSRGVFLSNREYLYRPSFELGRTLPGFEVQKILAAVDLFERAGRGRVGIFGYGEGGMIALYAAALDERFQATVISGFIGNQNDIWRQPIDRNVYGLLESFGQVELAWMIAPRCLVIEAAQGPHWEYGPGGGGAPAVLESPPPESARRVWGEALSRWPNSDRNQLAFVLPKDGGSGSPQAMEAWVRGLNDSIVAGRVDPVGSWELLSALPDPESRMEDQVMELDRHTQRLLVESPYERAEFMRNLDPSDLEKYALSSQPYRRYFEEEIIGRFEFPMADFNARSRRVYEGAGWVGYEVVLDVFENVFAFGVLLLPDDLKPGERRPVVVCQHGLEGRPKDTIQGDHWAYHDFAAKLAERGFITFAPQNPYLFEDRFRTLQRKAYPMKKTLFSIIVPQHRQITGWLKDQPWCDPDRIAFYGLSYGGKTAMRVPPLVDDYCLSICSADFNDWVWKNASTRSPYSYVWTREYEIFEFNLGSTFNYYEMASLMAPRPFMVERGHFDGVAPDERVAMEFAKVRRLYAAQLGIPSRCEIEWFNGPHTIHGKGSFEFLHRHLNWPKP